MNLVLGSLAFSLASFSSAIIVQLMLESVVLMEERVRVDKREVEEEE